MKKTVLITSLLIAALAVVGVGVGFAQGPTPYPGNGPMMQNGAGYMHTYMIAAFAEKLSLQVEDVQAQLAAGESMYDIAIAAGVKAEDVPALMVAARAQALNAAVRAGVITQEQADWMDSHGFGRGYGTGNCPMQNEQGNQPNRGPGMRNRNGHGMMGGGLGWQNRQANP